jgi:hypothetical protein
MYPRSWHVRRFWGVGSISVDPSRTGRVDDRPADPAATRRERVRRVLGKPGSLRRWIVGSLAWLGVCLVVFLITSNFFILLLALFARTLIVGDEDEFHAELHRSIIDAVRGGVPSRDADRMDPADWFALEQNSLRDAPTPPSAEVDVRKAD